MWYTIFLGIYGLDSMIYISWLRFREITFSDISRNYLDSRIYVGKINLRFDKRKNRVITQVVKYRCLIVNEKRAPFNIDGRYLIRMIKAFMINNSIDSFYRE